MQYTQEYDEQYMLDWDGSHGYKQTIQPYLKSADIWKCPSNPKAETVQMAAFPADNLPAINYSYAANPRVIVAGWGGGKSPSLSFIKAPASKIVISEDKVDGWEMMYPDTSVDRIRDNTFAGHMGTMNCLFVDGHVKSMRPLATATPLNMWGTMDDNTGKDNEPGGDCDTTTKSVVRDGWTPDVKVTWNALGINCDTPSQKAIDGFAALTKKYQ